MFHSQAVGGVERERGDGVRRALLQRHQRGLEAGRAPRAARARAAAHAPRARARALGASKLYGYLELN